MSSTEIAIPRRLPILSVNKVLLPGTNMRLPVQSTKNLNLVQSKILGRNTLASTIVGVVPSEYTDNTTQTSDDLLLHPIGVAAVVVQVTGTNWPRTSYTLLVQGLCRFKIDSIIQETPYVVAAVTQLDHLPEDHEVLEENVTNLIEELRNKANTLVDMLNLSPNVLQKMKKILSEVPNNQLPDITASLSLVQASHNEKLSILDAIDLNKRISRLLPLVQKQIEALESIKRPPKDKDSIIAIRGGRRIDTRLPGRSNDEDDTEDLDEKLSNAGLPEAAKKIADRELKRLKKMPPAMPEHAMLRMDLDEDHYGLDDLKKRVVEYLAVRRLKNSLRGPILCFIGPPGVGKTSVGQSIAKTLGRKFHRIALGGCSDQSDIRGHRRTYIGSMPGRIIQGIKQAGTKNPVILLDEIDKLGRGIHGDPAAALLEVLDPAQNFSFTDHYVNTPFDLSQVLFVATANQQSTIPGPLLDRMEVITVPGYTRDDKLHISKRHLIKKQLQEHGLTDKNLTFTDEALMEIINKYTLEAGVRNLDRQIAAVCRSIAVKVAESKNPEASNFTLDVTEINQILGPENFEYEKWESVTQPGVAIGLAWTSVGGKIMYVEASRITGTGKLTLTGQLGDVMKESATLALNWLKSHAPLLDIVTETVEKSDVHIHFPAGAVPKDGPSAGVTIVTVLVSLFTDKVVRSRTAMTGELTLRGYVLPVGGIKEKVIAAHQAGIRRVILPEKNEKNLVKVPQSVKDDIEFVFVKNVREVILYAFDQTFPKLQKSETLSDSILSKL
ncbi:DgyrCDS6716 [Dimorphilus gyrociliatus]|uniref:Lon protease homolog n=1 Tax=Dimorphilus gyrociliatus TaxID=2664684 RepID=A0A7I8VR49_9ANNE|nr:DgyrCDS6716 [Dimorphilus gyrociliatus]